MQTVKVQVRGQYYWQDGRSKNVSAFGYTDKDKVFVEVPVDWLHAPLMYIQRHAIKDILKARNEKATNFRVCEIVGEVPQPPKNYNAPTPKPPKITGGDFPEGPQLTPEPTADAAPSEFPTNANEVESEIQQENTPRAKQKAGKK